MRLLLHIHRWHFDVALSVGVAIFGITFWVSTPTPKWQGFYSPEELSTPRRPAILGYSADSQHLYSNFDNQVISKEWHAPRIQRWDARTGEMIQEYSLQMPIEDQAFLGPPQPENDPCFWLELSRDRQYLLAKHYHSQKPQPQLHRLYRINGTPIGKALHLNDWDQVTYVQEQPPGRHWGLVYELRQLDRPASPVKLVDFDSGKTMWSIASLSNERLFSGILSLPGGRYFVLPWRSISGQHSLEIVETQTGISKGRYPLPAGVYHKVEPLDETHWAIVTLSKVGTNNVNTLRFFIFDPDTQQLMQDTSRTLPNVTVVGSWMDVRPPYLAFVHHVDYSRLNVGLAQPAYDWLRHKGFSLLNRRTVTYRIAGLTKGELLRELTLVNSRNNMNDRDFHSIAQEITSPEGKPGLEIYDLPSYLWVNTLSWLKLLCWLLILPWPLRFLVSQKPI